jgi:hypothetical protein
MEYSNFKTPVNLGRISAFKRINFGFKNAFTHGVISYNSARILGPMLDPKWLLPNIEPLSSFCSKCLSSARSRPFCSNRVRCRCCLHFGHVSGKCRLLP